RAVIRWHLNAAYSSHEALQEGRQKGDEMYRFRALGRGGRVFLAVVAGGAVFGIATAVHADIPDSGVIHGCYGKPGTPQKGQLRVRDASKGEQCRYYENQVDWRVSGVTGATGATGATGPTGPAGTSTATTVTALV